MKIKEIEKRLKIEADSIVPNLKDELMSKLDSYYSPSNDYIVKKKMKRSFIGLVFAAALVLFTIIPLFKDAFTPSSIVKVEELNTYVSIDINPSIELEIDKDNKVTSYRPLNKEAMLLLFECELIDLDIRDAVKEIVNLAIEVGYINKDTTDNALMITAINDDEVKENEVSLLIKNAITIYLQEQLLDNRVNVLMSNNDDFKNHAKELGVSVGRYLLITKACDKDQTLTFEQARVLSVKELNELINGFNKEEIDNYHDALKDEFKEFRKEFNETRDLINERIDKIEDILKDLPKIKNKVFLNRVKQKFNNFILENHLDWEFKINDPKDQHEINALKVLLDDYKDLLKKQLDDLQSEFDTKKNDFKKQHHQHK